MQALMSKLNIFTFKPEKILNNSVKAWVGVALIGQWLFAAYIISLYALPSILGYAEVTESLAPSTVGESKKGFDSTIFFMHVLPAALMAMSGLFQLFPSIRRKYPTFHRYNGRMFFTLGLSGAFTGLYLTWGAGFRLSDIGAMGITLNGILIPIAICLAWRTAIKKQFVQHQRFAVHSFILVNGVWSFRLYLMGWYVMSQGGYGNTQTLDGPADIALSFACYLLPMCIAEFIFWAKRKKSHKINWFAAIASSFGFIITLIGVITAGMMMWYPRIIKVIESVSVA